MTLKTRRILYSIFILIFMIITPLIILYATGYKIGPSFSIQKTGMIVVSTEPEGGIIFVNGEVSDNIFCKFLPCRQKQIKTPARIQNLLPGEYTVRVEMDSYWPWEKILTVRPGETTLAEDIFLFKKSLPLLILPGKFDQAALSPNGQYIITAEKNNVSLIDLKTEEIKTLSEASSTGELSSSTCLWSPKNKNVIVNRQICSLDNWETPISINTTIGENIDNVKWDEQNDNRLYYVSAGSIKYYDLDKQTSQTLISNQLFSDYQPKGAYLYYATTEGQNSFLNIIEIATKNNVAKISLPFSQYEFQENNGKYLNLYDTKNQTLYLVDPLSNYNPLKETISNVKRSAWMNADQLLYANDYEIWILDMSTYKKTLLTRISQPVTEVIPHPSNNYIIYSTDKDINIIELDERDKRNLTKLFEFEYVNHLIMNETGDTLYFQAKIGNQEGIYKMGI